MDETGNYGRIFSKVYSKEISKNATILCGCAGYGSEVKALVDLYGKQVIKQITVNDKFFTTHKPIQMLYNNIKVIGGILWIYQKEKTFTFVTIQIL